MTVNKINKGFLIPLFFLTLAITSLFMFRPLTAQSAEDEPLQVTADLDGVSLEDFISFVSRFTGKNIVFREDRIPDAVVSMQAQQPMSEPELMAVFESILAGNNLELVSRGDVLYILHTPLVKTMSDPFVYPVGEGRDQELMTTVIQLGPRAPVRQAAELLKPFLSRYGMVQEVAPARAVLIRDTRERILKLARLVDTLYKLGPEWETELLPLQQAEPQKAAQKIAELYQGLIERGQLGDAPVVLPVEWSNSIMVAGAPDQLETVGGLVKSLDDITVEGTGLKIYPLKNARAKEASDVLRNLLSSDGRLHRSIEDASALVVSADENTNSLLVLADSRTLTQVDEVIDHLDRPLAQVFVEALIVETTLEHSQEFGIEWLAGGGGSDGVVTGGFVAPDSRLGPLLSDPAPPVADQGFSIGALGNTVTYAGKKFSTLGALINFLKSATDFNILSTPQIMTMDNSEAEIFVGENRPYLVSERVDPQNNVIRSYDYRDVGIRLLVTPTINMETKMIRLAVEQEVKNIIDQLDARAPTTMSRDTRTNVQLPSGSTMVISGLMENSYTHSRQAVPGLSQIPAMGWMFRRESISAPKTTLMVFLSARIIETLEQADEITEDRMGRVRESRRRNEQILEQEFWGRSQRQEDYFRMEMPSINTGSGYEFQE